MSNTTNPDVLNPEALRKYRKEKGYLTQRQLAEKIGCRPDQVNRWETGRSKKPRSHLRQKLTEALGVSWDALTHAPEPSEKKELFPTIQLNVRVHPKTRTELELVSQVFGVRRAAIVEIAPLLFSITAYKSLADRKKKIAYVEDQLEQASEKSRGAAPHLAPAFFTRYVAGEAIDIERESIKKRELFGPWDCYDGEDIAGNNPYANYIESMLDDLPDGLVNKDAFYSPDDDVPKVSISTGILRQVVGLSGDTKKNEEIISCIAEGDIDIQEVLDKKDNLPEPDYLEWLSEKTEEVKAEQEKLRLEMLGDLPLLLEGFWETTKGSQDQTPEGSTQNLPEEKRDKS